MNLNKTPTELDKCLADYLLSLKRGDQLLSTRELAELYNASLGSVSATLNYLEEVGAVTLNRRGRLGSFLEQKSVGALWSIVENDPMIIALTLPSFPKCEGLATAIYSLLNQAGVETYLIFIRGSLNRIKALRHGHCHAAIMSELAADELSGSGEEVLLRLPPESFVSDHRVFYRRKRQNPSQPLTVGTDPDSFDIQYLTELEFADGDVNFHPMTFTQIDLNLEASSVDAAITNSDHLERLKSDEITSRPLSPKVQAMIAGRDTSAALVVRADSKPAKIVLSEILDPVRVLEIQQQVINGLLVPRY
ncbi:MAG: hypothetical protein HYR94_21390 [Chloroflexi bacterium]|nr:hypothetical protein [Chloroflexota bacterium]